MSIRARTSGIMIPAFVEPEGAPYQGPGDIAAATVWWGLRGYNASYTGAAIDIADEGSAATATINILAGGDLDYATLASSTSGWTNICVTRFYDQTGGGIHWEQATEINAPLIVVSPAGLKAGLAGMQFIEGSRLFLKVGSFVNATQPFCTSAFAKYTTADAANGSLIFIDDTTAAQCGFGDGIFYVYANGAQNQNGPAVINDWHALQGLFNGTSSSVMIDGTTTATGASIGAGVIATTDTVRLGGVTPGGLDGYVCEFGIWDPDISSSFAALDSQQRGYWLP